MERKRQLVEQFHELIQQFSAELPDHLASLERTWAAIQAGDGKPSALEDLHRQAHSLAGASASLGFKRIARAANDLQNRLREYSSLGAASPAADSLLELAYQALREAILQDRPDDLEEPASYVEAAHGAHSNLQEKRARRLIYIVDDDPIQVADLAAQIGYFGYAVQIFSALNDLETAMIQTQPTVLLMDISFPEGRMAGYDAIISLRKKIADFPPVIFVSINDSIDFRLQAVRVGGQAYFTKPVDTGALIDVLDRIIFHEDAEPFRVLIVEDSRVQANYYSLQLKKAGMLTEAVADPLRVIDHLIRFNPDLLLLDMYMPGCTGMELAAIIRQMEQFISVPIVFLSAEADKDKQMAALEIGGDDFLTKEIEPDHLISAVTTRIVRYRNLRMLMLHDSLTGLLNHSITKDRLSQEVERARREKEPLAYAMLDLDHFKLVNDTYGHATGDRVLKSLAHLLRQRLRATDTIGRIGGEEFAIIFPDTDEKQAAQIMHEIGASFAKVRHLAGEGEFTVSFSCGIAAFPEYDRPDELSEAADAALYAAKSAGRNQVFTASDGAPVSPLPAPQALDLPLSPGMTADAFFQHLIRGVKCAILRFDRQGCIAYGNDYAQRLFGYRAEELVGRSLFDTLLPDTRTNRDQFKTLVMDLTRRTERFDRIENECRRKDGRPVWMSWSSAPVMDENGQLLEVLSIGADISDRKAAEYELTRTLTYLTAINHISQTIMSQQNFRTAISEVSNEVVQLFKAQHVSIGLLADDQEALQFIGDSPRPGDDRQPALDQVSLAGEPASFEVVHSGKVLILDDAQHNPLLAGAREQMKHNGINVRVAVPLLVSGKGTGVMNIDFEDARRTLNPTELELAKTIAGSIAGVIEISKLFDAEQRQRKFFEALVENIPAAVERIDLQSRIQSWNPAAEALFGYTAGEAIGRDIDDLLTSADTRAEAVQLTHQSMQDGERIHFITHRTRKGGSQVEVELFAVPLFENGRPLGSLAIYHDITELQNARREAEAANEAKSAFLATMSHEIRTPLNAVVGMTTLLLDTHLTREQREFTETIRSSSDALLSIINDILDFSKIEAGRMELEEEPFDLRECIESAFDLVAKPAAEKGIDLAYSLENDVPPFLTSDATRLRQILINLLGNALKFTSQGEVVLSVAVDGPSACDGKTPLHFAVRDTGVGIPADRQDRLFRSFSQVDASTTRKYGGSGLGLAISKRLSELLGGRMWVESEGIPGKGSTFHFTILAQPAANPAPVFLEARQPQLTRRRALIVDDNATNRYILTRQLQSWGMVPEETAEPRQALEWIRSGKPYDVVLLDMQMPEMDGLTLATEIQRDPELREHLPLVMLTSLGIKEVGEENVHWAAFLTKPIKPANLYSALLKIFGSLEQLPGQPEPSPFPSIAPQPLGFLRILLAEDMAVNQKVALLLLGRVGCRADVVGNGLEVLEALRRQTYDVILMDVLMPEMDGLEAARAVRNGAWRSGDAPQPYIIAMTANAMQGDREACIAAGMDDYISKPVQLDELVNALQRAALARHPAADHPLSVVIHRETFEKFQASLGEEGQSLLPGLVQDFLAEGEQLTAAVHQGLDANNPEAVQRAAHSLKSSSRMFGALELSDLCQGIEAQARAADLASARAALEALDQQMRQVHEALQEWLRA